MKIAVCFSGQLRFVKEYSQYILPNLIQLYENVDVYAHLWYSEEMVGKQFHHEFQDKYKENPEEFIKIYSPKKYIFEKEYIHKYPISSNCVENDLKCLKPEEIQYSIYRYFSQWYSVKKSYELIENPSEYDFIIRLRTDVCIQKPILLEFLDNTKLYIQSGRGAGRDRRFGDWFMLGGYEVMNDFCKKTYEYVFELYKNGIIHIHIFIELLSLKYNFSFIEYDFSTPFNNSFYKHRINTN